MQKHLEGLTKFYRSKINKYNFLHIFPSHYLIIVFPIYRFILSFLLKLSIKNLKNIKYE